MKNTGERSEIRLFVLLVVLFSGGLLYALYPSPSLETTEETETKEDGSLRTKKTIEEELAEMSPNSCSVASHFDEEGKEIIVVLISPKKPLRYNVVLLMRKKGGYRVLYLSKEGYQKPEWSFGFANHKWIFKEWLEQEVFEALVGRLNDMGVEFLD